MKYAVKCTPLIIVITFFLNMLPATVSAATETYYPTIDTYVSNGSTQSNNGSTALIASGGSADKKFIMHFDFSAYNLTETSCAYINLYVRGAVGPNDGKLPKYIKFYAAEDNLTTSTVYSNTPTELMFLSKVHSYYSSAYWIKVDVTHYINRLMDTKQLTVIGDIDGGLNDVDGFELTFDSNEGANRPNLTLDRGLKPYDIDKMLSRDWEGDTIYNESILPIVYTAGTEAYAKLKMPATEIVSVTDYSMTTIYTYGTDYYLQDGKIYIPSGSRITFREITDGGVTGKINEFDFLYNINATSRIFKVPTYDINGLPTVHGSKGIYAAEGAFHTSQLLVTYKHSGTWSSNYIPASAANKFANTLAKLKSGDEVKIVVSGSSTSADANSSGNEMAAAPHLPGWGTLVAEGLADYYNNNKVRYFNFAHGGQSSITLGVPYASEIANKNPDLVMLGFFTNETGTAAEVKSRIQSIMSAIRAVNPNAEFMLIASYNTNPLSFYYSPKSWVKFDFDAYRNIFKGICAADDKAAFMDLGGMSDYIKQDKNYESMTGNNINHPNDYMHRMYAKMALTMMCDEYTPPEEQPETTVQYNANYSEGYNAALPNAADGWTLTANGSGEYAGLLTKHFKIEKTASGSDVTQATVSLGSYGFEFSQQMNIEMDFYVTGEGQNTNILFPMVNSSFYVLGMKINDNGLFLLSYNGSLSTKICDLERDKLYTLKLQSIKTNGKAKLFISSDNKLIYSNDMFGISSTYGQFKTVVYQVLGANTSFNLKRFAVDGRYDNYANRFDYFADSNIPSGYTASTNETSSYAIEADPDFVKQKSSLALISKGQRVTATRDLASHSVDGNYIKYSALLALPVTASGVDIYLQSGTKNGVYNAYLAFIRLIKSKTGEDTTLTLQHIPSYGVATNIKTGINDLGGEHLLDLYVDLINSRFNVFFDGELVGKDYQFYGNAVSAYKNVEFINYSVIGNSGNSFIIKDQSLTALNNIKDYQIEIIYDMKPDSLKGGQALSLNLKYADLYFNNGTSSIVNISNIAGVYIDRKLVSARQISEGYVSAASIKRFSSRFPYTYEEITNFKNTYGNENSEAIVKFFLWDSFDGLKPIGNTLVIK